jgi:TolA-binding protein
MDAQQTQPSDSFYNFVAWLEVNKRKVMIWTAAALAGVIVVVAVISYQAQKERRASEALSNVRAPSTAAATPTAGSADAYLKVARDHAGTQAAGRALLLAASTRFQEGAYADAQKLYEEFTRDYPESRWLPQAYFGIASSLDAQGKAPEALKQFEQLRRQFPNDAVADETKLALARIYEGQNKPAEAFKLYDELLKANPYSGLGSEAGLRQADLVEKHPELAKTNLPPAITPQQMITMTNMMQQATNRPTTNRIQVRPMTNTTQIPATNVTVSKTQVVNLPLTLPTNSASAAKP